MAQISDASSQPLSNSPLLFEAPNPFTALSFTLHGELLAGGSDGSVRVYNLSVAAPRTLCKAIRGLPDEVSSLCTPQSDEPTGIGRVWVASGKQILLFDLDSDKMVIDPQDAKDVITLIEEGEGGEDNVLNEIAVSKDLVAFSCDSGAVGVWDIQAKTRKIMKAMHSNICGTLAFVSVRPREIISGGYDSQLIHFDAPLGSVLSKLDMSMPASTSSPISLSPPFILAIAIGTDGKLAAVTADGRLIVGRGGEKARKDRGNKRKWKGLNPELISQYHVADGPVVGVSWTAQAEVVIASLGGQLKMFQLPESPTTARSVELKPTWATNTNRVDKVNSLATHTTQEHALRIAVGGLASNGRGCLEIWWLHDYKL
ncbi:WD40 domain protein [Ceratobasidium sp. AG-Ba]|nr:WD40 domain protein [Ceratobasidium sp. AG-Ba]